MELYVSLGRDELEPLTRTRTDAATTTLALVPFALTRYLHTHSLALCMCDAFDITRITEVQQGRTCRDRSNQSSR